MCPVASENCHKVIHTYNICFSLETNAVIHTHIYQLDDKYESRFEDTRLHCANVGKKRCPGENVKIRKSLSVTDFIPEWPAWFHPAWSHRWRIEVGGSRQTKKQIFSTHYCTKKRLIVVIISSLKEGAWKFKHLEKSWYPPTEYLAFSSRRPCKKTMMMTMMGLPRRFHGGDK